MSDNNNLLQFYANEIMLEFEGKPLIGNVKEFLDKYYFQQSAHPLVNKNDPNEEFIFSGMWVHEKESGGAVVHKVEVLADSRLNKYERLGGAAWQEDYQALSELI